MDFYAHGSNRADSSTVRFLLPLVVVVLGLAAPCCGQAEPFGEQPPPVTLRTLVTGTCLELHKYAESIVGTNVIQSVFEFLDMMIRFLAEGAASGLNVIAVYVTEILRVTGIDVQLPFPRFTPEGVTAVAQWGLVALIGYWVLNVLLRLLIAVVRRTFWVVKTVLSLWLFGLIVSDSTAEADTTAVRLAGLVLVSVLLGLACSGSEKTVTVENRLSSLEGRLSAVEKKSDDE